MTGTRVTILELQRQAAQIADKIQADREPVFVTQRGRVGMVLLDVETFTELQEALQRLEALELRQLVQEGRQAYAEGRFVSHAQMVDEAVGNHPRKPARKLSKRRNNTP